MKRYISVLLLLFVFSSCEKKKVDLLPIDILTGGSEREWNIVEYYNNGQDEILNNNPCFTEGSGNFIKGDAGDKELGMPIFYLKMGTGHNCQDDEKYYFQITEDKTEILFYPNKTAVENGIPTPWDILEFSKERFSIQYETDNIGVSRISFTPKLDVAGNTD